jgi:hypothetical protein
VSTTIAHCCDEENTFGQFFYGGAEENIVLPIFLLFIAHPIVEVALRSNQPAKNRRGRFHRFFYYFSVTALFPIKVYRLLLFIRRCSPKKVRARRQQPHEKDDHL